MSEPATDAPSWLPVDDAVLPQLSDFLAERFRPRADENFAAIDYLRWQYLEWPKGAGHRAFSYVSENRILAHSGIVYTRFLLSGKKSIECPVASTLHSWVSMPNTGPLGAMLLFQSFENSEVQYAFSFSPKAEVVLRASDYELRQVIPTFRRVLTSRHWNRVYPGVRLPKRVAFRMQETALGFGRVFLPSLVPLELQQVTKFDEQAEAVAAAAAENCILTERHPEFLNHLLRHPFGQTLGYYIRDEGSIVGLAMLHFCERNGLRHARILDCLMGRGTDSLLCARALASLEREMVAHNIDVAFGIAGPPWLQAGYRRAGFVRRGRNPLLIRDPQQRLPLCIPVHMAFVDSDLAFTC